MFKISHIENHLLITLQLHYFNGFMQIWNSFSSTRHTFIWIFTQLQIFRNTLSIMLKKHFHVCFVPSLKNHYLCNLLSYSDTSVCFHSGIWALYVILSMIIKHFHIPNLYLKRNCIGNFLISTIYSTYKWNLSSVKSLLAGDIVMGSISTKDLNSNDSKIKGYH